MARLDELGDQRIGGRAVQLLAAKINVHLARAACAEAGSPDLLVRIGQVNHLLVQIFELPQFVAATIARWRPWWFRLSE